MSIADRSWGVRTNGRTRLRRCPACGEEPIEGDVTEHIAGHVPEDFGLSPLGDR